MGGRDRCRRAGDVLMSTYPVRTSWRALAGRTLAVACIAGTGVPAAAASKPAAPTARVDDARLRSAEREPDQWLVDGGR